MSAENPVPDTRDWITADEAAARLQVKRETVYAYVSRGRIKSKRSSDGRGRVLNPIDIERLASRARGNKRPSGEVIESAITLIKDDELFYRGRPARDLATNSTFEHVAESLWGELGAESGRWEPSTQIVETFGRVAARLPATALPVDALRIVGSCQAAFDPPDPDPTPRLLMSSAKRVLMTMISALPALGEPIAGYRSPLVALLWSRLSVREPSEGELDVLNAAMIMLADHDLARSTIAVRFAASAGLGAGSVIRLGMDFGGGVVKGVASLAIEAFLHNLASADAVEIALNRRLKQGEPIPGFGHPMYALADPRGREILDRLRAAATDRERLATIEEVIRMQLSRGLPPPNAGFALAALTYVTGMGPGAGETVFVVARSAGWIAHAIEALESAPMSRGTSVYVGPPPQVDRS